ncbi:hypothetical protein CF326_g1897 [Tilletia indica]|nr:hypothetical protein CF326_g1897 [Tilletia indica]
MTSPFSATRLAALAVPLRRASPSHSAQRQGRRRGRADDDGLTLEHFLLRTRFLALYRSIVRATRDIPNPEARRDTLDWYRSDLFPPSLKLETDLINLKEALAQGYRQLKQIQGQFTLVGAGGIKTARMNAEKGEAQAVHDPAGYTTFLDTLLERDVADRLVLDLRPTQDFAARHLQNATHLPGGWAELNSRFSTYLPPRGAPFLVLCLTSDEADVRRNLGERDGLIAIIVCRPGGTGKSGRPSTTEEVLTDPLGASESSFWAAAERKGVLRSSASATPGGTTGGSAGNSPFNSPTGSRRSAHTLASTQQGASTPVPSFYRSTDDTPHLMGQPSPALARTYQAHIRPSFLGRRTSARAVDLGCGAGRDLAWLAYRGQMDRAHNAAQQEDHSEIRQQTSQTEIAWQVTGLDNVRPVLHRAQHLMDAYGLMLSSGHADGISDNATAGCEALLWGQVSPTGSILALRTSGSSPDTGGRNGKPFLAVTPDQLDGALLPQGASAYALALPHGQNLKDLQNKDAAVAATAEPFDLVLLVRFLPRPLLWDRPETIHALVRRGVDDSAQTPRRRSGGFVLISHFVVPEEAEAITLTGGQPVRRIYDAPPEPSRLQAGEVRRLVQSWNAWWAAQELQGGAGEVEGKTEEEEWGIVEDVIEPIEDGRAVQSILIQRR